MTTILQMQQMSEPGRFMSSCEDCTSRLWLQTCSVIRVCAIHERALRPAPQQPPAACPYDQWKPARDVQ